MQTIQILIQFKDPFFLVTDRQTDRQTTFSGNIHPVALLHFRFSKFFTLPTKLSSTFSKLGFGSELVQVQNLVQYRSDRVRLRLTNDSFSVPALSFARLTLFAPPNFFSPISRSPTRRVPTDFALVQ